MSFSLNRVSSSRIDEKPAIYYLFESFSSIVSSKFDQLLSIIPECSDTIFSSQLGEFFEKNYPLCDEVRNFLSEIAEIAVCDIDRSIKTIFGFFIDIPLTPGSLITKNDDQCNFFVQRMIMKCDPGQLCFFSLIQCFVSFLLALLRNWQIQIIMKRNLYFLEYHSIYLMKKWMK